jgi:hypothetical protein
MLIGNRDRFGLELTPVEPSWEQRYEPEAAAWAGLSVWVDGKNLCAHIREGEEELRTAFFVPLGPLADWIVRSYAGIAFEERPPWFETSRKLHEILRKWGDSPPPVGIDEENWLDHREGFWSRHFLAAGAEGAWLPNLGLLRTDGDLALVWAPPRFLSGPRLTLLSPDGSASVPWSDADLVLSRFVDEVAKAFSHERLAPYHWLAYPAPRLPASLAEAAVNDLHPIALYCARPLPEVATLLGVGTEDVVGMLGGEAARDPATNALCQVLRDLPPQPSAGIGDEARAIYDRSEQTKDETPLRAWHEGRTMALDAASAGKTAVEAGQLAAYAVRRARHANGQPIHSTAALLQEFGVGTRESTTTTQHEHMLLVAAGGGAPFVTVLRTKQTETPWGRRFEEARALGHALLDPIRGKALGAASTRWAQDTRRRRSGAFAAELLLPATALEDASGGRLDAVTEETFTALLGNYRVGARTAAYQLYNHKFLSRPIRDELIARHARDE